MGIERLGEAGGATTGGSNGRESQGVGEEGKEPAVRAVGAW